MNGKLPECVDVIDAFAGDSTDVGDECKGGILGIISLPQRWMMTVEKMMMRMEKKYVDDILMKNLK